MAHELIVELVAGQIPCYFGGSIVGRAVSKGDDQLGKDSSRLYEAMHTLFRKTASHPTVNQDLMFRVFHAVVAALQALPPAGVA